MSSFRRKLWKWTAGTVAVLVILLGLALGLFRLALEQVPDYRTQIQDWVSERSGLDLTFTGLDARWRIYGPELVFENAVVSTPEGGRTLVRAREGSVGFDIWGSLATGRLTTGRFWLDAPELNLVRTPDGRIQLVGQDELPERTEPFSFDALPTGQFSISNARVTVRDLATGRGPWTFDRVALTLRRRAAAMQLEGTAELPAALGRELEFRARSAGQLDDAATLSWTFGVEGNDLDLAGIAGLLPETWPGPAAGSGSFRLSGTLHGARLESLNGDFTATGVSLPIPAGTLPLPVAAPLVVRASPDAPVDVAATTMGVPAPASRADFDVVRAAFEMERKEAGWHLAVDGLQVVRPGARWDPSRIELDVSGTPAGPLAVRGSAEFLSLDTLWPLLGLLPEQEQTNRLRALAGAGRVSDLNFSFERAAPELAPVYSVGGKLDAVGFAPIGRMPGLAGLTGDFTATDQGGRFDLAARDLRFTLPRLFREPLALDATGLFTWARSADRWTVTSERVVLDSADGKGEARFSLALPDDRSSPILEMDATGTDLDATATPRYLPAGRLTARTVAWFDRAFPAGKVTSATIQYRGPMRSFPFRNGEGTFVAHGNLENITLDYDPRWSPLTQVSGDVEFRNAGLVARAATGQVHDLRLVQGRVGIADLKATELDIQAKVAGDLKSALDYVQRSSVGPALGAQFMALEGRGAADIDAYLWLPIKDMPSRRIDVTAKLANAELGRRNLAQKLTMLNGSVQVLDRTLVSPGLAGRFLGGPVNIALRAQDGPAGPGSVTGISASGRLLAAPLKELLSVPDAVQLTGATAWRLEGRFVPPARFREEGRVAPAEVAAAGAGRVQQSYVIESDLTGLAIGLPAPAGKAQAERRALHAEIEADGGPNLTVRGNLGDLRTIVRLARTDAGWTFDRAGVRADGIAASIPGHKGVRIEGDIPTFVLDDWLNLQGNGAPVAAAAGRGVKDWLKAANVRVGEFGYLGYRWSDVRGLLQATDAGWQVDVAGPGATGQVIVPYNLRQGSPLVLTMEHLEVAGRDEPGGGARPASRSDTDPRQLPAVQARINDLVLGERQLGNVRLQMDKVPQGLAITSLTAQSDSFSGELKGSWLAHEGPTPGSRSIATDIDATISSTDVRTALRALGFGDVIAGERGLLHAKLSWPGGPDTQALGRASGTVHLEFDDGQVLDLQPGAGRMLGLFSVAALPRRLALDFSDLTDEGLAFDSIRGDFELKQGNAYTSNLLLDGPAAEIGIAGRTGLAAHDYDQTAVVTGNIGATLPVAGALAGGPVVGAAMLLFSQVFKEPLKGITRGYYRITGNWDEPQVERVVASSGKEAAALSTPARPSPGPATSP